MRNSDPQHFLSGAWAATVMFAGLWFVFAVAIGLVLMFVGVDVFTRWANVVCVGGASVLAFSSVVAIGRFIVHRYFRATE